MSMRDQNNLAFQNDLSTAIKDYARDEAFQLVPIRKGSFASWVSHKPARARIQDWQLYYQELLRQSWSEADDWRINGIGPLLGSDLICYAVTCLPRKHVKHYRSKIFGSPANRFAAIELLIIGHALWGPNLPIYFNPYTTERRPMEWKEVLEIESSSTRKPSRRYVPKRI